MESYERAIHLLLDKGKHDEAEAVMINETLPLLGKYHAAWSEFVEFQQQEVDAAVQRAQLGYTEARRIASLLFGLASSTLLTVLVIPAIYSLWRQRELRQGQAATIG